MEVNTMDREELINEILRLYMILKDKAKGDEIW